MNDMKRQLLTEEEAMEKIIAIEEEYGIKYTEAQRKKAVEALAGKGPRFD